jgi:peptidoglycan/LPS O-acetylase OafA/YrhL
MIISSESLIDIPKGWRIFGIKRIIRIVPIYWIMTTYKLVILLFASSLVFHARLDWIFILKSYFFIPAVNIDGLHQPFYAVGWTLNFEMFFYLLFTISLALRIRPLVFLSIILIPLSFLSIYKTSSWSSIGFYADPIVLNFLYGMIAAKLILYGKKLPQKLALPLILVCLIFVFLPRAGALGSLPNDFASISIATFLIIYGAASIENYWSEKIPKALIYLGGASYSLYLVHPSVAPFAPTLLNLVHLKWDILSVALAVTGAIIVGTLFYKLCESPLTKYISKQARKYNLV